jgi:MFS family permease
VAVPEPKSCQYGLNGLNFSLAAVQTGFGPFVAVWLTRQGWNETEIGLALSVGTAAGLLGQLPAGLLVDAIERKRLAVFGALIALAGAALLFAAPATLPTIWGAQILHALASAIIVPAIAALTLAICGQAAFGERLGVNARWGSIGNASTGGAMGLVAYYGGEQMVFVASAGLVGVALVFLVMMRAVDRMPLPLPDPATLPAVPALAPWARFVCIFQIPALHVFAVCALLFHLANAAMLPLALNALAQKSEAIDFAVSATIVLPQAIVVLLAPWAGGRAQIWGRKPILCVGFAALPLRAMLFSTAPDAPLLVVYQMIDGISATVFGLMMPLVAADLTRKTGHLTLAISSIGLAAGIGATFSTTIAGLVADLIGPAYAFYGLAGIGVLALLIVLLLMPETKPADEPEAPPLSVPVSA